MTGCQINFDKGEGNPSGLFTDDIRSVCSELSLSWNSPARCYFDGTEDYYFTYRGKDWVPCSCRETQESNGTYLYDVTALPRCFFSWIEEASKDSRSLAVAANVNPTTVDFENIEFPVPLRNRRVLELLKDYSSQLFQEAYRKRDMSGAVLLYLCGENLLSLTLGRWMNTRALSLDTSYVQANTSMVDFYNDRPSNELLCDKSVGHWENSDYLQKMFGRVFTVSGTSQFIFLGRYTLKLEGSNEFDSDKTYMCIRCEEEIGKPDGFVSTFAEINYVDGGAR